MVLLLILLLGLAPRAWKTGLIEDQPVKGQRRIRAPRRLLLP